jgi:hypothetical protein
MIGRRICAIPAVKSSSGWVYLLQAVVCRVPCAVMENLQSAKLCTEGFEKIKLRLDTVPWPRCGTTRGSVA